MPRLFDPSLVNDPFGDPGVLIDLMFERRALLFDLGDLSPLPPRKLLRISDVFVSHRHMDHFIGFDQLLRVVLGRDQALNVYGPPGMIDAIDYKLSAYAWNLVSGYAGNLEIRAHELDEEGRLTTTAFQSRSQFDRGETIMGDCRDFILLREPRFEIRAVFLDHGIPSLGFALEETVHVNVMRNKIAEQGLKIGPWLRELKETVARGDPDETPVTVEWDEQHSGLPPALPLGQLKREVLQITPGRKIAYVVDAAYTPQNSDKIISLAYDAELLFIEAPFLDSEAAQAEARQHLTARQAGSLARRANVKRIVTLHYSPRYEGRGAELEMEALSAFRGIG